jgi:hypothetical protein
MRIKNQHDAPSKQRDRGRSKLLCWIAEDRTPASGAHVHAAVDVHVPNNELTIGRATELVFVVVDPHPGRASINGSVDTHWAAVGNTLCPRRGFWWFDLSSSIYFAAADHGAALVKQ